MVIDVESKSPKNKLDSEGKNDVNTRDNPDAVDINCCDESFQGYFGDFILREIWNKKRCYFPFVTQIIDQTTDIAVMIQFYQIYTFEAEHNYDCKGINGGYLFWSSVATFCVYRIVSCIWVYTVTDGKKLDTFLQLFDLKLYHALYINFRLHKDKPCNPQRFLQMLEATLESFPQCVIQMYYLIRIGSFPSFKPNFANNLIMVSFIMSIFNISTKTIEEDKVYFLESWRSLEFNKHPFHVNWKYVLRFIWRVFDISLRLVSILLVWLIFGGMVTAIYISFESFILMSLSLKTKRYVKNLIVLVLVLVLVLEEEDWWCVTLSPT